MVDVDKPTVLGSIKDHSDTHSQKGSRKGIELKGGYTALNETAADLQMSFS